MNKRFLFGMLAAAGMLLATSCSSDELEKIGPGNEAQVTFALHVENGVQTKAISDGKSADKLVYAVFDESGNRISTIAAVEKTNVTFPTTESITLAKGQTYQVAFWAQDADSHAYTVNTTNMNVAVNYDQATNNDETRDAFFKTETFTVTGSASINVTLKRPFAQINVGVTEEDWKAAVASGVEIEKSKVKIEGVANSLNLLTGKATGEVNIEYALAAIPTDKLEVDTDGDGTKETFNYLSMSYLLPNEATTGAAKTTVANVAFEFVPKAGKNIELKEGLTNVPVQRNWRTNIVGQLLTGKIDFTIKIDPIYDGEYNNGKAKPVNINGVYYASIQEAIKAAQKGDVISIATGSYQEVIDVTSGKNLTLQAAGPDVVIAGIGHQSNANPSTILIKGITFDNSLAKQGWFTGTAQNIEPCVGAWGGYLSFEDCKFIVDGNSKKETGVMTWWTGNNLMTLTFNNCTFEGKNNHQQARAMQIYGNVNMEVTNCTFTTAKDYTLKYVANEGNKAIFSNNRVSNSENFVELGSSVYPGKNYTVTINNNILGKGVNTHVIANQESQTVNVNGNTQELGEGLIQTEDGKYVASSSIGLANAIKEKVSEIYLEEGHFIIPDEAKGKTLTFVGKGNPAATKIATQDDGSYEGCDYSLDGSTVTFENISINTNSKTYTGYARCNGTYKNCIINGTYTLYGNSTFEGCTFNVSGNVYNIWTWGAPEATFTNCTFNSDGKAMLLYGGVNTKLTIENSVFNDKGGLPDKKAAIEIGNDYNQSYQLIVNKTIVNGYEINNKGINTGSTLWGNKNSMPKDKLNVVVDGVDVY